MDKTQNGSLPLAGVTVVVTRSQDQSAELREALETLGARVILFPTIRIAPPADRKPLLEAARNAADYDWLILTSINGAEAFLEAAAEAGTDLKKINGLLIAAVGASTAEKIRESGHDVAAVPEDFSAEGMVETLRRIEDWPGRRVLFPKGDKARSVLPDELRKSGASVDEVVAYRNVREVPPEIAIEELVSPLPPDAVTFTSPSAVKNFTAILGPERMAILCRRTKFISIGPTTSKAMRDLNLSVDAEADPHDLGGLVQAVLSYLR